MPQDRKKIKEEKRKLIWITQSRMEKWDDVRREEWEKALTQICLEERMSKVNENVKIVPSA